MQIVKSNTAHTFSGASDALQAAVEFESGTEDFFQYEISVVFDVDRNPNGYRCRVKDLDGFGVGYLGEV